MKKELIYICINLDKYGCFHKMGFNFSPQFVVSFDEANLKLSIESTGKLNIFKDGNIANVTALIGENGTGKTTLLKYLTCLSDAPIVPGEGDYEVSEARHNELLKYIAVYFEEDDATFKIINCTDIIIYNDNGDEILPYSGDDFIREDYIGNISHLYFSNGEYTENLNMRSFATIDYLTLTNNALSSMAIDFYKKQFNAPEGMILTSKYNALQTIFSYKMTSQDFQSIIDVQYYNYLIFNGKKFYGKTIETIEFSLAPIEGIIKGEAQKVNYVTEYATKEFIENYRNRVRQEFQKIQFNSDYGTVLIRNFLGELIFAYDFELSGTELEIENVYGQCKSYVETIDNEEQKSYYLLAAEEIDLFRELIISGVIYNNQIPVGDLAREEYCQVALPRFWELFARGIERGHSFILKYIRILNLGESSGERAILNFLSRIYFASEINRMIPESGFELHYNVLILVDEIDIYQHPEWQRRMLYDLLNELQHHFPEKHFQIVFSSHSPIVLSDMPCENSIFLKKTEDTIVQIDRKTQTFGANIHTLYKDAFFIEDGLGMGEFAKNYINQLIKDIQSQRISHEEAKKKLNIIGEPILRKKIYQILGETQLQDVPATRDEKQQMINFLRRQKQEIERQIALLEVRE